MRFVKVLCLLVVCLLAVVGLFSIRVSVCEQSAVRPPAPVRPKPRVTEAGPPKGPVAEAPKPMEKAQPPQALKTPEKAADTKKTPEKAPAAEKALPPVVDEKAIPPVVDEIVPDKAKPADAKGPPWTVVGRGADQQSADETALEKARDKVIAYLRTQDPPLNWQPSVDYVDKNLVKEREQPKESEDPILGKVHERTLRVDVDAKHYREMVDMDRQDRVQDRQLLLAKILGGILALLTAVFGYYKLDEVTKGYYTGWLRLAAVILIAAVGVTLFFVS